MDLTTTGPRWRNSRVGRGPDGYPYKKTRFADIAPGRHCAANSKVPAACAPGDTTPIAPVSRGLGEDEALR